MQGVITAVFLLAWAFFNGASATVLRTGEVGVRSHPWIGGVRFLEVTDGLAHITAEISHEAGLVSCYIKKAEKAVIDLLQHPHTIFEKIEPHQLKEMYTRCHQTGSSAERMLDTRDAGHVTHSTPPPPNVTAHPDGHGNHKFIWPGTLWCGSGNNANSYDDLGIHRETDKCCRTHDNCQYWIPGFTSKYHYTNVEPFTVSYCDCDMKLYKCLKAVHTNTSDNVGDMFFGVLGVQCFRFEEGEYCAKQHWTHLWCAEHKTDEIAVVHNFPCHWTDKCDGEINFDTGNGVVGR